MRRAPLLAAALLAAAPLRAATVRLALIEDEPTRSTLQLAQPLERVLRDAGESAALLEVRSVPVYFGGADYRFRLPAAPGDEATSTASVLEGDAEVAFVFPADDELSEKLIAAAADPKTFRVADSVRLIAGDAEFDSFTGPDGDALVNIRARLQRPATGRVRGGMAACYRLRWKGREISVAVVGRTYGGLGRLGAAAEAETNKGPLAGLSRGGAFGSASSDARGRAALDALEKAGLRHAAIASSELEHWKELEAYRAEKPLGVRWLSANLMIGTRTVVDAYSILEQDGVKVAVVGLTPPSADRALKRSGLSSFWIADPVTAVEALIPKLRAEADVVLVLSALSSSDQARLSTLARGIDLVLADDAPFLSRTPPPGGVIVQEDRPLFANAFPALRAYSPALNIVEIDRRPDGDDRVDWRVTQSAVLLDDSINPAEGYPEPSVEEYETRPSTIPALLPDARSVFKASERAGGFPVYETRDFWSLAAAFLAERGEAEAAVLLAPALGVPAIGEVREPFVRGWLGPDDAAVIVRVPGSKLEALLLEARTQLNRENERKALTGPRFVVAGVDKKGLVSGAPLSPSNTYKLATSKATAEALGLPEPHEPMPGGPAVGPAVLYELRSRAGRTPPEAYRDWMKGVPLRDSGLWRVNFRDVSLNFRRTSVKRDDAFDVVPNSRIQGSDELLIGGVFKADAEYLKNIFKWTNTAEAEYAKSKIYPRNAPVTTNLAANRLMLLTLGTWRAGAIKRAWLARSWGPSIGLQYDGEWEAAPGVKRKQAYSAFPGVELFDGSFVRSLTFSGILKRDLGREPPNTQTGLRVRAVYEHQFKRTQTTLQGELWNNYFFLTRKDAAGDLRLEGGATARFRVPLRKHLAIAPFADLYWFGLKTRPKYGWIFTTGLSIGFSRLWKPQYESF